MMCFLFHGRLLSRIKSLSRQVELLSSQTGDLTQRVEQLESQLRTGLILNPELTRFFEVRTGQQVRVNTTFVTLEGIVLATAEDGVQLRESSGDIVLIPFASITSVQ
ncbi:hypothetical protein CHH75_06885 [Paenibacillus sp. 7541]|uniref:DUF2642 domain-containing protein n=2 Tax=Paenibacillus TaxID=44249 RepID=A0A268ERU1_9BACL|nr:hypothetical protein [Paenibacillus campinasensis]PAD75824.1 hypothetical protein CHH67_13860 [Paenibacillus campinasensis]PAK54714.1 hypothetical protein CHH75_06885 [Paenibacillus sp. 7541]